MPIQQMFLGAGGPPPAQPLGALPVSGALWYYDGYYFTNSGGSLTWTDQSGNGRHMTTAGGRMGNSISQQEVSKGTNNLTSSFKFIQNDATASGMRWNNSGYWPGDSYTLMHICARGDSGAGNGRIFDGWGMNWLSGFHGSTEGVFYHNNWVTTTNRDSRENFIVCIDRLNRTRSKGYNNSGSVFDSGYQTGAGTSAPTTSNGIGLGSGQYTGDINSGDGESSKWECVMAACWSGSKSTYDCYTVCYILIFCYCSIFC